MSASRIRILTNIRLLNQSLLPDGPVSFCYSGSLSETGPVIDFVSKCLRSDLIILDAEIRNLMIACALKFLFPMLRLKIISVDLILRVPQTPAGRVKAFGKRMLLKQVDRFILFFRELHGCERFYGIGPDRTLYVPFKVNGWEKISTRPRATSGGEYVLCAGRTLRDTDTFVKAMREADCPAVLLQQRREFLDAHGTAAWSGELPENVRLVIDESDQVEDFLEFIAKARLVVIPRFRNDIAPTGISTYLMAMALNKCVILSEGPGAGDVLNDQAIMVPPENARRLSAEITALWNDDARREEIAARGYEYAMSLGGYERLLRDILVASTEFVWTTSDVNVEDAESVTLG